MSPRKKRRTRALCARLGIGVRWVVQRRPHIESSFSHSWTDKGGTFNYVGIAKVETSRLGLVVPADEKRRGRNRSARSRGPWRKGVRW